MNVRLYGKIPYQTALLHGGPGAPGSVAAIARELSLNIGVIEPLQTKYSIRELTEELDSVLQENASGPITLIGHSWGAWLALYYAAKHAGVIKKVVLVGCGPLENQYLSLLSSRRKSNLSIEERTRFDRLIQDLESSGATENDRILSELGSLVNRSDNVDTLDIETDKSDCLPVDGNMYARVWPEASVWRQKGELMAAVESLHCPITIIHGRQDPHPIEGLIEPLQRLRKEFRFFLLDQCGHSPWKERQAREKFYQILKEEILA